MKKFFAIMMCAVLCMCMLTSCGKKEEDGGKDAKPIKIGFIGPLTGGTAMYGISVANGAQQYFDDLNEAGGINGSKIEFIPMDSEGDPTKAINLYRRLVDMEGVCAIIGPVLTGETEAVAAECKADGVPCITASATGDSITDIGDTLFRTCFKDSFQGVKLADYCKDAKGFSKVAVLYNSSSAYSVGLKDAFVQEASSIGLEVVATEAYAEGDSDYKAQLTNIASAKPDAVFFPYYYGECYDAASQSREIGLNVPFFGGDGLSALATYEGADPAIIEGFFYSDHFSSEAGDSNVKAFREKYVAKFKDEPLGFSFLSCDAAMIVADAIKRAGSTEWADIVKAMKATDMDCLTGHYVFDKDNNPIKQCAMTYIANGANVFDRMF